MNNVLQFPIKKKELYDVLKTETSGEKFICFYLNEAGEVCYTWGNDVTLKDAAYIEKLISIFVHDEFKDKVEWGPN